MQRIISALARDAETGFDALAGADHGGKSPTGNLVENFQSNLDVMLLEAAESAAQGIKQEALGLVDGVGGNVLILQGRCPVGHCRGDGF
jgi:hypothetical protein